MGSQPWRTCLLISWLQALVWYLVGSEMREGLIKCLSQGGRPLGAGSLVERVTLLCISTDIPWPRLPSPLTWTNAVAFPLHLGSHLASYICFCTAMSHAVFSHLLCFCFSLNLLATGPLHLLSLLSGMLFPFLFTWVSLTHSSGVSLLPLLREVSLDALARSRPLSQAPIGPQPLLPSTSQRL